MSQSGKLQELFRKLISRGVDFFTILVVQIDSSTTNQDHEALESCVDVYGSSIDGRKYKSQGRTLEEAVGKLLESTGGRE